MDSDDDVIVAGSLEGPPRAYVPASALGQLVLEIEQLRNTNAELLAQLLKMRRRRVQADPAPGD